MYNSAVHWHKTSGGYCTHSKDLHAHALRLLNETIELCIACCAGPEEILNTVNEELVKAKRKNEIIYHKNNMKIDEWNTQSVKIAEEASDVAILLSILEHHAGFNLNDEVKKKLTILYEREWEADKYGVLWRKGKVPKE